MNQSPTRVATRFQLGTTTTLPPLPAELRPGRLTAAPADPRLTRNIAEGLQLTRASTIALTRLQLALAGGDRRQAMAAIDRLHAIDGEIEHLVERLPPIASPSADEETPAPAAAEPASDDPLAILDKHLADQKLALAFEKLALASGIAGPDLVSPAPLLADGTEAATTPDYSHPDQPRPGHSPAAESEPPLVDWHAFPDVQTVVWDRIPAKLWGVVLAVLVTIAVATAAMMMTSA